MNTAYRQPWPRFLVKATVVLAIIIGGGFWFAQNYRIGIDPQLEKCIPGYTFYLIDLNDKQVKRGETFAFRSKGVEPLFEDGTWMVKFVRGVPGDHIEIDHEHNVKINDEVLSRGLFLSRELQVDPARFLGRTTLQEHQFWLMGLTDRSFDSRYWGVVHEDQIVGRAYPLF